MSDDVARHPRKATSFLKAEVLNAVSSRRVAAVLTVAAFLVATMLYIQGLEDIAWYLTITYIFVPVLLLPVYVARTPAERQTRFALVLYTYPVSQQQYFFTRFITNILVGVAYVLVTLIFTLPLVYLGGPYWLNLLPSYLALSGGVIAATSAMGLFLGTLLGGQKLSVAAFIGFLVSAVAFAGTRIIRFAETVEPPAAATVILRLLHILPTVPAAGLLPLGSVPVQGDKLVRLAILPGLTIGFLYLAHRSYVGLQGPEGWNVPRTRVAFFSIVAIGLLLSPAMLPVEYGRADPLVVSPTDPELGVTAEVHLDLVLGGGAEHGNTGRLTQGVDYDRFVTMQFVRLSNNSDLQLHDATACLTSDMLGLDEECGLLNDGHEITAAGANTDPDRIPVPVGVDVQSVPGLAGGTPVRLLVEITTQETRFVVVEDNIQVEPRVGSPPRWAPFGLAAGVTVLAWGILWVSRRRNRGISTGA